MKDERKNDVNSTFKLRQTLSAGIMIYFIRMFYNLFVVNRPWRTTWISLVEIFPFSSRYHPSFILFGPLSVSLFSSFDLSLTYENFQSIWTVVFCYVKFVTFNWAFRNNRVSKGEDPNVSPPALTASSCFRCVEHSEVNSMQQQTLPKVHFTMFNNSENYFQCWERDVETLTLQEAVLSGRVT